jgi:hypothetical protein
MTAPAWGAIRRGRLSGIIAPSGGRGNATTACEPDCYSVPGDLVLPSSPASQPIA